MAFESVSDRSRLAQKLSSVKQTAAQAISDDFFFRHPEWVARYGDRGRQSCAADACLHFEFLAGAVEAGSPEAFADYSRWTARMLGARGIDAHTLEETLAQIEHCLSDVLAPEEFASVLTFLSLGRKACTEIDPAPDLPSPGGHLRLIKQVFLAAILNGHRQAAMNIIEEALLSGHSHLDIYVEVFTESLRSVGELWELNNISVAQEHIATSITQYAIAAIYPRLVPEPHHRGNMIVTGVAGELHQVGASLVADAMEAKGWTVQFLGTNLPHTSIVQAIEDNAADLLCISTTIVANLLSVAELIRMVRDKLSKRAPSIVLGGAAYRLAPRFASELGIREAFTDLRRALFMLCA